MDQLYMTSQVSSITRKTTFSPISRHFSKIQSKVYKQKKGHKIALISMKYKHFIITIIDNLLDA